MELVERRVMGDTDDPNSTVSLKVTVITEEQSKKSVEFFEGAPEDYSFRRDLSSAYLIRELIVSAYEAGKRGEELVVTEIIIDEEDW